VSRTSRSSFTALRLTLRAQRLSENLNQDITVTSIGCDIDRLASSI
jgi:hypothetical protein